MTLHSSNALTVADPLSVTRHRSPSRGSSGLGRVSGLGLAGLLVLLAGCGTTTVFQSSFAPSSIGAPPLHNQATGTIDVGGPPGSVAIVAAPPSTTGTWAQISRNGGVQGPITTMECNLSQSLQTGTYALTVVLFIPKGSGDATVGFDAAPGLAEFLHLDFQQDNTVRVNDDSSQVFGTFPRDQSFTLTVTLSITPSSATAHMELAGGSASGSKDYPVTPLTLAQQLSGVKFWMGSPWNGLFDVTNIIVTYAKP